MACRLFRDATAGNLQDKEELQRAMANKVPAKIDIGPMYNVDPQRRKAYTGEGLCTTHMSLQPFLVSRKFFTQFCQSCSLHAKITRSCRV